MWTTCVAGFSNIADNIAFSNVGTFPSSYCLEVRIRRFVSVLVVNDDSVAKVTAVSGERDFSTSGCKDRITLASGNVDTQVLVFV